MGNFGFNGGIPWLADTEGETYFVLCKQGMETVNQFLLECLGFIESFDSLSGRLKTKARDLRCPQCC